MTTEALYVGLMSGTSMDGIDAALVRFNSNGAPELLATCGTAIPASLVSTMEALCAISDNEIHTMAVADKAFAELSARAVARLLEHANVPAENITAIGSHGQTIRHQPQQNPSYTIQIGDPSLLAQLTGIDVIAHFRQKDMAVNGQGAPLVPAFHQAVFASSEEPKAILNLGGIANVTWLPGTSDHVTGFDTGPANTLLDTWFRAHHKSMAEGFDRNGQFAAQGHCLPDVLERLLSDDYFSKCPPKSTGRDDFNLAWLHQQVPNLASYNPEDVQQTLQHLTAASVASALRNYLPELPKKLYVCGGGALNADLMRVCRNHLPEVQWVSTAQLGIAPEWVEAMAFAWLAWCYDQRVTGNLPAVTGARQAVVLGGKFLKS